MSPKVSVVMPVYNGAKYVKDAIFSILNQNFEDFEFLIIDDKSTDNTVEVIKSIKDPRIRLILNEKNLGRAGSDNAALAYVQGKYIAKMDSDDICLKQRFFKQVSYLDQHPEINVVGSWMQNFGYSSYLNKYPVHPAMARCASLFGLPVGNPSIMLRAELFTKEGMHYNAQLKQTEDFDFFSRYADKLVVSTLPETLIKYRTYPDTTKKTILEVRGEVSHWVRENFLKSWGIPYSPKEAMIHNAIAHANLDLAESDNFSEYHDWLLKIQQYNVKRPFFDANVLQELLAEKWFFFCYLNPQKKFNSNISYKKSFLGKYYEMPLHLRLKFFFKGMVNFV